MKKYVSVCALALLACTEAPQTPQSAQAEALTPADLAHRRWVLESIDGEPAYSKPLGTYDKGLVPDLDFGESPHVSGFAGCNRYMGRVELNAEGQFRVAQAATTMMMCEPAAMEFEKRYLQGLEQWQSISLDGKQLRLSGNGEEWLFTLQDWVQ